MPTVHELVRFAEVNLCIIVAKLMLYLNYFLILLNSPWWIIPVSGKPTLNCPRRTGS